MRQALFSVLLALAAPLFAETYAVGAAAAPWIKLPSSARTAAMGEAGVAVAGDINALGMNPAGLSSLKGSQAALMHHQYVADSAIEHASFGIGISAGQGAALGIDYLNFGTVSRYAADAAGNLVADGSMNPNSMAINAGYGLAWGSAALGIGLKMVSQSLDGSASSSAFAADFGGLWRQSGDEGLSLGLAYQNLGTPLDGASLPANLKAGFAYSLGLRESADALLFAADLNVPSADGNAGTLSLGAEYEGASLWALRGGYKIARSGGAGGLSLGLGLSYSVAALDYAFVSQGVLGNSHEVSLTLKF